MELSHWLILLGGLLSATTMDWSHGAYRRTLKEIYDTAKAGQLRSTLYARLVAPVSVALIVVGVYLALTRQ